MRAGKLARERRGFTMVEALTALVVMSIVVRIGIPGYEGVVSRAEAVRAVQDFRIVQEALAAQGHEGPLWPRDPAPGQIPPELAPHLPEGFDFDRGRYRLDLQSWAIPGGIPSRPQARTILGLSVVTDDPAMGEALREILGGEFPHFVMGGTYSFILDTR